MVSSSDPPVTVCIPAWNEEATIAATIDSVYCQDYPGIHEIIVCANACTDRTEAIVRNMSRPDLRLLSIAERGKPIAWNRLFGECTTEIAVFIDGDIMIPSDCVRNLVRGLRENPVAIASALSRPRPGSVQHAARLLNTPITESRSRTITACCYAVNRPVLGFHLHRRGLSGMPPALIADHIWLSRVVGDSGWIRVPDAFAWYVPPSGLDVFAVARRNARGYEQIAHSFSHHFPRSFLPFPSSRTRLLRAWRDAGGLVPFIRRVLAFGTRVSVTAIGRLQVRFEPRRTRLNRWDRAPSTKRL